MANSINADELKDIVAHGPIPRLLDVRRRADLEAAPQKIEGASWYDPEKIDEWIDEIGRDEPVVVYCVRGGSVSQSVADRLEQKKVDARFINGGIMAWKEAEGPME
jgi:rhodanese-related sulfurtransferase